MFDFSGTLFRIESCERWLRGALGAEGVEAADDEVARYAKELERAGAQPGGPPPERLPDRLAEAWRTRDLTAERHRAAYTALSRSAGLPWDVHDALYERHRSPAAWQPYPDTARVLAELRGRGVPVAVVSNIGWDLRPVFRVHGVADLVDAFVLSYEHEAQKPDPRLFRVALDRLGVSGDAVRDAVMVGDSPEADGGAAALGCRVLLVDPLPVADRPDALLAVLDPPEGDRDGAPHARREPDGP
ncbi:putative hydrolase [Actinacidiphila reveromycinica]|uniref:Putative hydrolase n=1 Tax=Actinacidiphila reveromycinica TaxID=659352 RepID=A0A7U3VSF5_9ACTN|nr:HAD family hydrolase [Streptomyces sp. SN-593]BBB01675.1 putative hydrolase [Streptomyces sp. SN-593]